MPKELSPEKFCYTLSTASCAIGRARAARRRILSNRELRRASLPALSIDPPTGSPACLTGIPLAEVCLTLRRISVGKRASRGRERIAGQAIAF